MASLPSSAAAALSTAASTEKLNEMENLLGSNNLQYNFTDPSNIPPECSNLPTTIKNISQTVKYQSVRHHWFFQKMVRGNEMWYPLSLHDSSTLEEAFKSETLSPETKVPTDGGRYDVEVVRRRQTAVYWDEKEREVRRCSWFVKRMDITDPSYVPYEECIAEMIEEEYRIAHTMNQWNRYVTLPSGETVVIHSPNAIAHYSQTTTPDLWGSSSQMHKKPQVVKRGVEEFDIVDGDPEKVDHLLFLVHGIGQFCDLKFRPIIDVVDDFRTVSMQLVQSHFKDALQAGSVGRIEVLPISWHHALHNQDIDKKLQNITLQSIPKLRHFTNDTLLDILFYTSPVFCETITQAVGRDMNRLYSLFLTRNPKFTGDVFLGGHSLGSLILFDMLCNQSNGSNHVASKITPPQQADEGDVEAPGYKVETPRSRKVSYVTIGSTGTGQPFISYPQLVFKPKIFFALGSPIGMFITVRGIDSLGEDFALPTCPGFFNIFHPYDPVAYRVESLINTEFSKFSPVLIPHHKGRKRMHLELKDTLEHVGFALKEKLVESVRNTLNTFYQLTMFQDTDSTNDSEVGAEGDKGIKNKKNESSPLTSNNYHEYESTTHIKMGKLNGGHRIDYVLQEAPLESFNEYLFALSSHVCYWESEDTMLMMLKEIYGTKGISSDSQVAQQILQFDQSVVEQLDT